MEGEPSYWFALAAEDGEHHRAVTRLTDRVLEEAIDWFQAEAHRGWRAPAPVSPYWKVTNAASEARRLRLPIRGDFSGSREKLEASLYRAQLLLWQRACVGGQRVDVGFIARDTDHKPRKDGARQAVESGHWPFEVVLAFPHPEVEAWPIAVFEPVTESARGRVDEQARRLGYSPVERPERLTSTVSGGAADTKKVSAALFEGTPGHEEDWIEIDLGALRERGRSCGLTDFLEEVETVVVPLLAGGRPAPA